MKFKRKAKAFKTRTRGTKRQKGTVFPIFNEAAARRKLPKLHPPKKVGRFSGRPFAEAEERVPAVGPPIVANHALKAVERLRTKITKAKILVSKGTLHSIDQAITLLERELGIRGRPGAAQMAFAPSRERLESIIGHDPLFIETRQSVLNSRYAYSKARASGVVARREAILDEAARAILDISMPSVKEIRIRYPPVPDKRTPEEMERQRLAEKLAVTRAKARGIAAARKLRARLKELWELPPEEVRKFLWREPPVKPVKVKKREPAVLPEEDEEYRRWWKALEPEAAEPWERVAERRKKAPLPPEEAPAAWTVRMKKWAAARKREAEKAVKKEKKEEKEVGLKINYEAVGVEEE